MRQCFEAWPGGMRMAARMGDLTQEEIERLAMTLPAARLYALADTKHYQEGQQRQKRIGPFWRALELARDNFRSEP